MIGQSFERTVLVSLDECHIQIIHRTKTVWLAVGEYKGNHVEAKGRSAETAANNWVEAARISDPWN